MAQPNPQPAAHPPTAHTPASHAPTSSHTTTSHTTTRHTLFRLKAIASELRAQQATDPMQRQEWEELAHEWHLLANRAEPNQPPATTREPQGLGYYIDNLSRAMHQIQQRR